MTLLLHPVATLFPRMTGQQWDDFLVDLDLRGVLEPVWMWRGSIIDGQNRSVGLEIVNQRREARGDPPWPLPTREWDGVGSLVAFVVSHNIHRRHLDVSMRAMLAARAMRMLDEEERQAERLANLKRGDEPPRASKDAPGKTSGKAAKLLNVSQATVERAAKIKAKGSAELQAAVDAGEIKVTAAARVVGLPPEQQLAELKRQKEEAKAKLHRHDLRDALGAGGTHLETARNAVEKAAKVLASYDARKTVAAIERAQTCLAEDAARLLAGAE